MPKNITCRECKIFKPYGTPHCKIKPIAESWNYVDDMDCKNFSPGKIKVKRYDTANRDGCGQEAKYAATMARRSAKQGSGHI